MQDKIKTRRALVSIARRLRAQGKRIVFTNGCFDLLHVGHVRYLQQARHFGDALIVALNSDRSVRKIKDPKRPITRERDRAEVVAGLECVDYVTFFDEPNPKNLIAAIHPDVLVKGADWSKDRIIGGQIVRASGGKVLTIPVVPHVSTTALIKTIIKKYGSRRLQTQSAAKGRISHD